MVWLSTRKIEVLSEEEGLELAKNKRLEVVGFIEENNRLIMEVAASRELSYEELQYYNKIKKNYIIYGYTDNGILYISKSGVTRNPEEAKRFEEKEAKRKAMFMRKNGNYLWVVKKIR